MTNTEFYTEYNIKSLPSSPILYWSDLQRRKNRLRFQGIVLKSVMVRNRTFAGMKMIILVEITGKYESQIYSMQNKD